MRSNCKAKRYAIAVISVFVFLFIVSNFIAQIPTPPPPSSRPEILASPSPTESPTPIPAPSPTPPIYPIPGWQNFHQWGSITLFNGLPSNTVRAIAQTPDGLMWFGTDNGLAKFDGRRIQTISLGKSGMPKVSALKIGTGGVLWIGTSEGAFYYRNGRVEFIQQIGEQTITAISIGDNVLIATTNQIFRSKDSDNEFNFRNIYQSPDSGSESDAVFTGLFDTPSGIIITTYGNGLFKFDHGSKTKIPSETRFINAIGGDGSGNIWAGADAERRGANSGLYSFLESKQLISVGEDLGDVLTAEPDQDGGVWIGTAKRGLHHFRDEEDLEHFTFESTAGGLRSDTVYAIFFDREGVLWTGTNRGVCRFDASSPFIRTISENANSNFVRDLYQDSNGNLVAGTNFGLFTFDGKRWVESNTFPARTIYAVSEDVNGETLIGGPSGTYDIYGRRVANGESRSFANFRGKTYAAIFERGLQDLNDATSPPVFSVSTPTTLLSTDDRIWIGTAEGDVYTFDGTKTTKDERFSPVSGSTIRKIAIGVDGTIWIASSGGIFHLANDQLQLVVQNYDVRDLIVDGRDVWAATVDGGLFHIVPDDLYGWIVSDLNVEQGLPSQKVFALLKIDDGLVIGTNRGIVSYRPSSVNPKIIISRVLSRRLHDPSEWSGTIDLDFPQNSLLVEVAGLSSRTFPEQFQYSFILRNTAGDILEKRLSREAQYSPNNLKPGQYSIEAKAFSKDLLLSEPVTVRFSIGKAPFPWFATALSVLLIIALIALIWAIVERRRIVQRNRELAAARADLANEAERERGRIARDLHDQTLADLRNLMMKSDQLLPENVEFRGEIESVSTEIRRICEDLSPSVLENVGLVAALEFLLGNSVPHHTFSTNENADELIKFPLTVQLHIYRIAQEILSNIKRHSDADLVEMNVQAFADQRLILTIIDNGTTFRPNSSTENGRGIPNIRSHANIINAQVAWDEGPQNSNLFTLVIAG